MTVTELIPGLSVEGLDWPDPYGVGEVLDADDESHIVRGLD